MAAASPRPLAVTVGGERSGVWRASYSARSLLDWCLRVGALSTCCFHWLITRGSNWIVIYPAQACKRWRFVHGFFPPRCHHLLRVCGSRHWLADWLTVWVVDWLTVWVADWLTVWEADWLTVWEADGMGSWLANWLSHRLFGWRVRPFGRSSHSFDMTRALLWLTISVHLLAVGFFVDPSVP